MRPECLGDPFGECDAAHGEIDVGVAAVPHVEASLGETLLFQGVRNAGDGGGRDSEVGGEVG